MLKITKHHYEGYVYDLSMEKDTNFFADGVCVHNCGKKRYALKVYDSEGVRMPDGDYKIMGIEVVRSSTPMIVRTALKDCVTLVIDKNIDGLRDRVRQIRSTFDTALPNQIAFPSSANNLAAYSDDNSIFKKGCPIGPRAALLYNHLIRKYNLQDRYPLISEGDKIKFIYLKLPNTLQQNIVAFVDELPKEFDIIKYIDIETQFQKTFLNPLTNILTAVSWSLEEKSSLDDFF